MRWWRILCEDSLVRVRARVLSRLFRMTLTLDRRTNAICNPKERIDT